MYNFPQINGSLLTIDDRRVDRNNSSCFSNQSSTDHFRLYSIIAVIFCCEGNQIGIQYSGPSSSLRSAVTLPPRALLSNQTYQFMVKMTNRQNFSLQAAGYLIVKVEDSVSSVIAIG